MNNHYRYAVFPLAKARSPATRHRPRLFSNNFGNSHDQYRSVDCTCLGHLGRRDMTSSAFTLARFRTKLARLVMKTNFFVTKRASLMRIHVQIRKCKVSIIEKNDK
jgi:hypothetical protein